MSLSRSALKAPAKNSGCQAEPYMRMISMTVPKFSRYVQLVNDACPARASKGTTKPNMLAASYELGQTIARTRTRTVLQSNLFGWRSSLCYTSNGFFHGMWTVPSWRPALTASRAAYNHCKPCGLLIRCKVNTALTERNVSALRPYRLCAGAAGCPVTSQSGATSSARPVIGKLPACTSTSPGGTTRPSVRLYESDAQTTCTVQHPVRAIGQLLDRLAAQSPWIAFAVPQKA